jgi:hypothetical protein
MYHHQRLQDWQQGVGMHGGGGDTPRYPPPTTSLNQRGAEKTIEMERAEFKIDRTPSLVACLMNSKHALKGRIYNIRVLNTATDTQVDARFFLPTCQGEPWINDY